MQTQANRLLEQPTVPQTDPLLYGSLIYDRERIKEKKRKDGIINCCVTFGCLCHIFTAIGQPPSLQFVCLKYQPFVYFIILRSKIWGGINWMLFSTSSFLAHSSVSEQLKNQAALPLPLLAVGWRHKGDGATYLSSCST